LYAVKFTHFKKISELFLEQGSGMSAPLLECLEVHRCECKLSRLEDGNLVFLHPSVLQI
jgi:hypothetical protein